MKLYYKFVLIFTISFSIFGQVKTTNRPLRIDRFDFAQNLLPRYVGTMGLDSVYRYDFTVTMRDGVIIDALKYIPYNATPPAGGWPTVIMVHGFGDNKETLAKFCHDQAQYGYYTATYSVRGQGKSGGFSNLISVTEALDVIDFVTYIKNDSIHGSNPNNILIMGGSQGGLLPYMAACYGLNVKTIISALSPPNFASSWIENGSIKMTFLWTITYNSDTARYTPLVTAMSNWVYANNKPKWDSLAYWVPINRDFMNYVLKDHIPMIVEGSWQDKFFNAAGIIQGTTQLTNSPLFRMYIGAVQGHGGDHSPTEDQWHMNFFNDWFFYWLFGVQNGENTAPKYEYASTTLPIVNNYYTFVHDSSRVWPPAGVSNMRLYFNTGNKLTTSPNTSGSSATLNNKIGGGLTMQEAVDDAFTGSDFTSRFTKSSIYFQTNSLTQNTKLIGTPKINLNYQSSNSPFCQFNFQMYEVTPNGTLNFINRINYTDRNYTAKSKKTVNITGQAHSHIFQAGDKIRIVLTNLDTTPYDSTFLATNPFVLPVLLNSTNTMYLNSSSYIDLPVTTSISSSPLADDIFQQEKPDAFSLEQNYPNPFNPTTNIKYSLQNTAFVKLAVYDLLGRQVAVLVNEMQKDGSYTVSFDASRLASGIYFYKLNAGSYQDIKRMILIK